MQNRAAAKLFPLLLLLLLSPYVESFTLQPFHPSLASRTNGYVSFSDRSPRLSTPRSSSSTVRMSENLPKNIKDSLQQLRNAMQAALSSKCSRMDVEFPYGSNIGVEGRKTPTESDIPMVGAGDAQASDRELARAMVEMFRGTEIEENLVVAFTDSSQANKATKKWAGAFAGEVIVLDSKQSKKPARGGGGGFGASAKGAVVKARASAIPPGTEVLIVVGPTVKDLKALEHICSEVGMGCLVILANARLDELRYESDSQVVACPRSLPPPSFSHPPLLFQPPLPLRRKLTCF
eukprot:766388-Hanusia_phi.AAC.1